MRILLLSDFYKPILGGLERQVESLGHALARRGHEVALATLHHPGLPEFEDDGGVRVYRVQGTVQRASALFSEGHRRFAPPLPDPETALALWRIVRRERPAVVHAHSWIVHSFLPVKPRSGARLAMSLHDFSLVCPRKTLMRPDGPCSGPALRKCLPCAAQLYGAAKGTPTTLAGWAMGPVERAAVDLFLPVSRAVAERSGLPGGRAPYRVLPNFLPESAPRPAEELAPYLAQLPADGFLLFVGSLGRHKGVDVLLRAYAALDDAPPLVLIGTPSSDDLPPLPPGARVLQSWPHWAVQEAWRRCLIGLAPSVWPEPFGLVVLEAMAAGRPVVGARAGAIPELVADGVTGLLAPPGDSAALATCIAELLRDPGRRARMGAAGAEHARRYRAEAVVGQVESAYGELLGGGLPRARAVQR